MLMAAANTLAYYGTATLTTEKGLMIRASGPSFWFYNLFQMLGYGQLLRYFIGYHNRKVSAISQCRRILFPEFKMLHLNYCLLP